MEKKEITVCKDKIVDAMAKASTNITNRAPEGNAMLISSIVMIGALLTTELVDILFGGGVQTSTDEIKEKKHG